MDRDQPRTSKENAGIKYEREKEEELRSQDRRS